GHDDGATARLLGDRRARGTTHDAFDALTRHLGVAQREHERVVHRASHGLVQPLGVILGCPAAAGDDGTVHDAPVVEVDRDDRGDEAALAEQPALTQHLAVDAADRAVDVDLLGGYAVAAGDAVLVDDDRVTFEAHEDAVGGHA